MSRGVTSGVDHERHLESVGDHEHPFDLALVPPGQCAFELDTQVTRAHLGQVRYQVIEAPADARLAIVGSRDRSVKAYLDEEGIDFALDAAQNFPSERVAIRLDACHEAELTSSVADSKEIGMGQRLPAGEAEMQTAELAELLEQKLVVGKSEWLAFELYVVIAERTVEVTSIGELEQS